ncbi:MAG: NAD(P)-binding protein [Pseudomonadota bacterium]
MKEIDKIIENCRGDAYPRCQDACPAHIDVRKYITLISQGEFNKSLEVIRETMPFPAVCGRVCTYPCESQCERNNIDQPVAIRALKRFVSDYEVQNGREKASPCKITKEKKVAIIGSGPAGLSCAYDLIRKGYFVTIFEAMPKTGGLMRYGIPAYRLPDTCLDNDIEYIRELGVEIKTSQPILSLENLLVNENYDAVFMGVGAKTSVNAGLQGVNSSGVFSALDFLEAVNNGEKINLGKRVIIVGGGNAAIDSARAAKRLGADNVSIIYRRSRDEMPADPLEIKEAELEGVNIRFHVSPVKIIENNGKCIGVECLEMKPGEVDDSGRPRPIPIKGSEFVLDTDNVIIAIGQSVDKSKLPIMPELNKQGTLAVDEITMQTNTTGVFAGGDVVSGASTVIKAIAAGKEAAVSIDRYLSGQDLYEGRQKTYKVLKETFKKDATPTPRSKMPETAIDKRLGFDEVELGFDEQTAIKEAQRCLVCECKSCMTDCEFLNRFCDSPKDLVNKYKDGAFIKRPAIPYCCNICDLCEKVCPEGLNIGKMCNEAKQELVECGKGPLPTHKLVIKDQDWVRSDEFMLSIPNPDKRKSSRVFMPGCHLSAYSPQSVISAYDWLISNDKDTGIILKCCGNPTRSLGDHASFQNMIKDLTDEIKRMGAEELILACPNCLRTISQHDASGIKIRSLYDVLAEEGIVLSDGHKTGVFSIHDPCAGRFKKDTHNNIRKLVSQTGNSIIEMEHHGENGLCCGMGGMIAFASFDLAQKITKKRVEEAKHDILTYCATCREALAQHKPTIHVLDLLFNPNWDENKAKPPNPANIKKDNQSYLKAKLTEIYS